MGNELFGVDIAGIIADATDGQLMDVVVTRYAEADEDPDDLTGGDAPEPTSVTGIQGFWEDFTGPPPPGVLVELNDRKAVLIGDTIPAGGQPLRRDAITIEGQTLYVWALLSRDPAAAVFIFHCKDRRGPDGA